MLLLLWLALGISSCCTIPEPEIIVHTETVLPQEISFPEWPEFYEDEIKYLDDGSAIVPEWLWIAIAEYYQDVKKAEELYKLFRSE